MSTRGRDTGKGVRGAKKGLLLKWLNIFSPQLIGGNILNGTHLSLKRLVLIIICIVHP